MKVLNGVLATVLFISMFISSAPTSVAAQTAQTQTLDTPFGEVVCLPGNYQGVESDCQAYGPSKSIQRFEEQGMPYPLMDLPASHPSQDLAQLDVSFAKLNIEPTEKAAIYASVADAVAGQNPTRYIEPGENVWVSFVQRTDVNGGHYVMLRSGEWMRASPAGMSYFSGLEFHQTPRNNFGWVVDFGIPRVAPGYQSPEINKQYRREDIIQIYKTEEMNGTTWYQVGIDEWLERRYVREFIVNTIPPEGVAGNRWIDINLYEQTLGVYENNQLVYATLIATGAWPYFTAPGVHTIDLKKDTETMTGSFEADRSDYYYLGDVPWTMYFFEAQAIHGAYWRAWFGYPQSHGCVNLSIIDSRWVYDWAKEGDYVYIWDPSGETPTDPKYYEGVGSY